MKSSSACCHKSRVVSNQLESTKYGAGDLPTVIIGAGPVGLAAAAHLATAGEKFLLLEAGSSVGTHILDWGHVRLFSPWRYNLDKASKELLLQHGWAEPPGEELPNGRELVDMYLAPLAALPEIQPFIQYDSRVLSVSRRGQDRMKTSGRASSPFLIYVEDDLKRAKRIEARAVIDATGTWAQPNPLHAAGVWIPEERELTDQIFYGIPDVKGRDGGKFLGKRVAVIGGGHSAINTILELVQLDESEKNMQIIWILRKDNIADVYGGEEEDSLEARGELGQRVHRLIDSGRIQVHTPFLVENIFKTGQGITIEGVIDTVSFKVEEIDEIIVNTGFRPDFSLARELRLNIDPVTESVESIASLIDPNLHSCGTVRPHGEEELRHTEQNFYIVGMKSYGRAPTFLLATGYEQVRSIVAYLSGDLKAARKVELDLPETGICKVNPVANNETGLL